MLKLEIRPTFSWMMWKVNIVCWWNLSSSCNITKETFLSKSYTKNTSWKRAPSLFVFITNHIINNLSSTVKFFKEADFLKRDWICNGDSIKIYQNQHADFLIFLFTKNSSAIKRGTELVSESHFLQNVLIKILFW